MNKFYDVKRDDDILRVVFQQPKKEEKTKVV